MSNPIFYFIEEGRFCVLITRDNLKLAIKNDDVDKAIGIILENKLRQTN